MAKTIQDFKSFTEAERAEHQQAMTRTPTERILLLHQLIHAWMKFPRRVADHNDTIPTLKRTYGHAGNT